MRLNRFYTERTNIAIGSSVKLQDSDTHHIRKVLRLQKHDQIVLFNGEKEFLGELTLVGSDAVTTKILKVLKSEDFSSEGGTEITLFQSLLRPGKFDFIVEKATELGINRIVPVECEFSQTKAEIAKKRIERWNKIAIAASKQSERITIPEIVEPINFKEIVNFKDQYDAIYFFTIPRKKIKVSLETKNLKEFFKDENLHKDFKKIAYIVGTEGGFSPTEHELASEWSLKFVTMGKTVLRSETASIAFLSILQYVFN